MEDNDLDNEDNYPMLRIINSECGGASAHSGRKMTSSFRIFTSNQICVNHQTTMCGSSAHRIRMEDNDLDNEDNYPMLRIINSECGGASAHRGRKMTSSFRIFTSNQICVDHQTTMCGSSAHRIRMEDNDLDNEDNYPMLRIINSECGGASAHSGRKMTSSFRIFTSNQICVDHQTTMCGSSAHRIRMEDNDLDNKDNYPMLRIINSECGGASAHSGRKMTSSFRIFTSNQICVNHQTTMCGSSAHRIRMEDNDLDNEDNYPMLRIINSECGGASAHSGRKITSSFRIFTSNQICVDHQTTMCGSSAHRIRMEDNDLDNEDNYPMLRIINSECGGASAHSGRKMTSSFRMFTSNQICVDHQTTMCGSSAHRIRMEDNDLDNEDNYPMLRIINSECGGASAHSGRKMTSSFRIFTSNQICVDHQTTMCGSSAHRIRIEDNDLDNEDNYPMLRIINSECGGASAHSGRKMTSSFRIFTSNQICVDHQTTMCGSSAHRIRMEDNDLDNEDNYPMLRIINSECGGASAHSGRKMTSSFRIFTSNQICVDHQTTMCGSSAHRIRMEDNDLDNEDNYPMLRIINSECGWASAHSGRKMTSSFRIFTSNQICVNHQTTMCGSSAHRIRMEDNDLDNEDNYPMLRIINSECGGASAHSGRKMTSSFRMFTSNQICVDHQTTMCGSSAHRIRMEDNDLDNEDNYPMLRIINSECGGASAHSGRKMTSSFRIFTSNQICVDHQTTMCGSSAHRIRMEDNDLDNEDNYPMLRIINSECGGASAHSGWTFIYLVIGDNFFTSEENLVAFEQNLLGP